MDIVEDVKTQLDAIRQQRLHGIGLPAPSGTLRGIDVLGAGLLGHLVQSAKLYRRKHQRTPNLVDPTTFTERQVLFKFFGPVPTPVPSDKLRACAYLPTELRPLVRLPRRSLVTNVAQVPMNDEVAPGSYFFKSNHSSGRYRRVDYPLSEEQRQELQSLAEDWMVRPHNPKLSLWWEDRMERNLYLEEDLGSAASEAPDWKFFVCNGRVELYQVDVDRVRNHVQTLYERDGTFIPQELYFKSGQPVPRPARLDDMIAVAEGIGRSFDFMRVDMFLQGDAIILGELALVPNGASLNVRSPDLDQRLGRAWTPPWFGQAQPGFPGGHYDAITFTDWPIE